MQRKNLHRQAYLDPLPHPISIVVLVIFLLHIPQPVFQDCNGEQPLR